VTLEAAQHQGVRRRVALRKRALPKRGPWRVLCGHEGATAPFSIANDEKQDHTPTKKFGLRGGEVEAEEEWGKCAANKIGYDPG